MAALTTPLRRFARLSMAFLRLDARDTLNYPAALGMEVINSVHPVALFYFVSRIVDRTGASVAGDYFTFVVIGLVGLTVLDAGLKTLSRQLQRAISQGQLEILLTEPISWQVLPFTMVQWSVVMGMVSALIMVFSSLLFGAKYLASGVPLTILILALGLAATLPIGVANAAIRVLAKRVDPILTIYSGLALLLSGTFFPLDVLPGWLRTMSWFIPHTYVLQAARRVLMPGGAEMGGPTAAQAMLGLVALCILTYPLAIWFYRRSMQYGRKMGLLGGY